MMGFGFGGLGMLLFTALIVLLIIILIRGPGGRT